MSSCQAFDLSLTSPFWKEDDLLALLYALESLRERAESFATTAFNDQREDESWVGNFVLQLSFLGQLNDGFSKFLLLSLCEDRSLLDVIRCAKGLRRGVSLFRTFREYPQEKLMSMRQRNLLLPVPDISLELVARCLLQEARYSVPGEFLLFKRLFSARVAVESFSNALALADTTALEKTMAIAVGEEVAERLSQIGIAHWEDFCSVSPEKLFCQIGEDGIASICTAFGDVGHRPVSLDLLIELIKSGPEIFQDLNNVSPMDFFNPREHRRITFEELGKARGFTRARAQQIAANAALKLQHPSRMKYYRASINALLWYMSLKRSPISLDEASWIMGEEKANDLAASLLFFERFGEVRFGCSYYKDAELFLPCDSDCLDDLVQRVDVLVPEMLSEDEFQVFPEWARKILLSKGRRFQKDGIIWPKGEKKKGECLLAFIHESFPLGYKIYDERHWSILRSDWKARFGKEFPYSPSYIRGLVSRYWRNSDRGTYLPKETGSLLSEDALAEVYHFIEDHPPLVYYKSIYNSLKDLLTGDGFANENDFKSAFDSLDSRYAHTAHYLKRKDWPLTGRDTIYAYMMDNCPAYFTNDMVRAKFPFVENYTIEQIIDAHDEIVHLGEGFQLRIKDAGIPTDALDDLRDFLIGLMEDRRISVVGCSLAFEILSERDPDLLARLKYAKCPQALFMIAGTFLPGDFVSSGEYISRAGSKYIGKDGAIQEYIDAFAGKPLRRENHDLMLKRWGIGTASNFASLFDKAWETHVEVRADLMVPKSDRIFPLPWIRDFGLALENLLPRGARIDTKRFQAYYLFPCLNKGKLIDQYVLAGVTRSYFHDRFVVKANRMKNAASFEIWRRDINE